MNRERQKNTPADPVPNILFSTTRMWNCGDDFILFGIRNLLDAVLPGHNAIVYNRNPDLHTTRVFTKNLVIDRPEKPNITLNLADALKDVTWKYDNSWRPARDLSAIDYCVFAGTPEWMGSMVSPLVHALLGSDIPICYLGIGSFEGTSNMRFDQIGADDVRALTRAQVITVRDQNTAKMLSPLNPVFLPCPALFAAPAATIRKEKIKVALCMQGHAPGYQQRINENTYQYTLTLFKALSRKYDCSLICHYIDEVQQLQDEFHGIIPIRYSYDARDYIDIYDEYDACVTTRVHGAGLCSSLGIPSIVISHSARSETVHGFLADTVDIDTQSTADVLEMFAALSVEEKSRALIRHKNSVKEEYLQLLRGFFGVQESDS